jgi:phosphoribosylglycinamide formyltransferase-1
LKVPIVVLASGRGSNFQAILKAIELGILEAEVRALIVDRKDAGAIQIAEAAQIPVEIVEPPRSSSGAAKSFAKNFDGMGDSERLEMRKRHDEAILRASSSYFPKFLVLAGYKRVIGTRLIEAFRSERGYSRIINIHPSLLPAFPGLGSYKSAFQYGVKATGVTVHLVEAEVDQGPVCAQQAFEIGDCKNAEDVEKRGLAVEHKLYSETLGWVLPERFEIESRGTNEKDRRTCVFPS